VEAGGGSSGGHAAGDDPSEALRLLDDPAAHQAMAKGANPHGDGHAAERLVRVLLAA
jgi:UDP-N-acetylglucosamine 2-epimerase